MSRVITSRDEEVLATLSLKVHLASLGQLAVAWWPHTSDPNKAARERLRKLESDGWLHRRRVNIHPMLSLDRPVASWKAGDSAPNFGSLAYQLQTRWKDSLELETVYIASKKTANRFGGFGGKFKHRTQLTHDIHLASIYFSMLREDKGLARRWSGEEERSSNGEKLPDAVLLNPSGAVDEVIEFGGEYDRRRVESFHLYCDERGFGYQLW